MPGDGLDIGPGFARQPGVAGSESRCTVFAAVVGHGGQTQIAEALRQLGQIGGRSRKCCGRVERVDQPALFGGGRNELGDAKRPGMADGVGVEQAFAPDQPAK